MPIKSTGTKEAETYGSAFKPFKDAEGIANRIADHLEKANDGRYTAPRIHRLAVKALAEKLGLIKPEGRARTA